MCYNLNQDGERLELDLSTEFKAKPNKRRNNKNAGHHLNGLAHPELLVLATDSPDELQEMEWGLVPFWVKSAEQAGDIANKTLNAKAEPFFSCLLSGRLS